MGSLLQRLPDPDPNGRFSLDDYFGRSVAVSGNVAVVGAIDTYTDSGKGAVYIYVKAASGWPRRPSVTLSDPAGAAGDAFGQAVAISGNTILVGAPGTSSGAGGAYLYVKTTSGWPAAPTATLPDPGGAANAMFGHSVALSGQTAVVGAPGSGSAYLYAKGNTAWPVTPTVTFNDPASPASDLFGLAVAVSGSTAVVGAPVTADHAGAAYLYVKTASGWPATPTVTLPDPGSGSDAFGSAVAVAGITAVIGASGVGAADGTAYIYTKKSVGWQPSPAVTLQVGASGAGNFGQAVTTTGQVTVVGATGNPGPQRAGGAYFYVKTASGWPKTPTVGVRDPGGADTDEYGGSVAASGTTALVGAEGAHNSGGQVFIYQG